MPDFLRVPEVRREMTEVIAEGVATFVREFTRDFFTDPSSASAQSCICDGIAQAILKLQADTGRPIATPIAYALLDQKEPTL